MKRRKNSKILTAWALLFSLFSTIVTPGTIQAEGPEDGVQQQIDPADIIPGEIIVRYKEGFGAEDLAGQSKTIIRSQQATEAVDESEGGISLHQLQPGENVDEAIKQLEQNEIVEYAEPNLKYYGSDAQTVTNDTYYGQQWGIKDIEAEKGWPLLDQASGSVTVAVLDTGVDGNHPDLAGRVLPGKNFALKMGNNQEYPAGRDGSDDHGHGTMVAGIISALSNNQKGITGVVGRADVKVLPIKVMNEKGYGSSYDIAKGIRYAADSHVAVINLSLGSKSYSKVIAEAVAYAQNQGVLVVAAAGNDGKSVDSYYPAALPSVMTVGAIASNNKVPSFSNYGKALEIVAPGEGIWSTTIREATGSVGDDVYGYYKQADGTSFAAPHVSAAAALYLLLHPGATAGEIASALTTGAADVAPAGRDDKTGFGKLKLPTTLQPGKEPQWTVLISEPAVNSLVLEKVTIKAEIIKDKEKISKLRFYLDGTSTLIAEAAASPDISVYPVEWDTTKTADGAHTLIVVAYEGDAERGRYETAVTVRNNPESGLMLKILDPQNNPATGSTVTLFKKVQSEKSEFDPSADSRLYSYEQVWSGQTSSAGAVRIPSSIAHDMEAYKVIVQGQFDYPNAPEGSTLYMYQRTVEGPGIFTINGADTVPVKLSSTDKGGQTLASSLYFATAVDENQVAIGTTAALNDEKTNSPTIYLDKGKYNLYSYSKSAATTYFQSKPGEKIASPVSLLFDGTQTGQVTLAADKANDKVVDGVLYLFNESSNQSLGLNEEVLVGTDLRVTAGSYQYWADIEVQDPNGGQNWIYVFGSDKNQIKVSAKNKAEVKVGGGLNLAYYEPDTAARKAYLEKTGKTYVPEKDPTFVKKSDGIFYTKQKFADKYDNMLVGMYRGHLAANGVWQRIQGVEKPEALSLDTEGGTWQQQGYYFGDMHANYKSTRLADNYVVYDSSSMNPLPGFRQFFWTAFWMISRPDVTPGAYKLELSLENNPLAGKVLSGSLINTVYDEQVVSFDVRDGTKTYTPYLWIYHADKGKSGNLTWEKSFGQWADRIKTSPTYQKVLINSDIPLSKKEKGNLAIIRYETEDGKFAFLFRPFTQLSELAGTINVDQNKMHLVEIQAMDEKGAKIQAAKSNKSILYPVNIDGKQVHFRHMLGADDKKGVWLEEGTYQFDGQFVTLPDASKNITNYYLLARDVAIEAGHKTVELRANDAAKIKLDLKDKGSSKLKGAALLTYSDYSDSMLPALSQGNIFYLPANVPVDLVLILAYSDPDDRASVWNFMIEGSEGKKYQTGKEVEWKVGTFEASLNLDRTTLDQGDKLTGKAAIKDEYDNRIFTTFIDSSTSWVANEAGESDATYLYRWLTNGEIEPVDYAIDHEEGEAEKPNVVYPYLRVFQQDGGGKPVLNVAKKSHYNRVEESINGLLPGQYRAELAFAAGPNQPIVSAQTGNFTVKGTYTPPTPPTPPTTHVSVTRVLLNQEKLSLQLKDSGVTLRASIEPANATNQAVNWSSSDTAVATVDQDGLVTPVGVGEATITVTTLDGGKTASCVVKVNNKTEEPDPDAKLLSIEASERNVWLKPKESVDFKVFALYSDETRREITTDADTRYKSSSSNRVSVKAGTISAGKTEGTATVTVTYKKQKIEIPVQVSRADIKELAISKNQLELISGSSQQVKATALLSDERTKDVTKQATWTSSDAKVATVKNGKITAVSAGTTQITAEVGGESAQITVTVAQKEKVLKRISVSSSSVKLAADKDKKLKLTAYYQDGTKEDITKEAEWVSENEAIATVREGVITGLAQGKTNIVATYQQKTVTVKLIVTE